MAEIGIVIVTHNSAAEVSECVAAALATGSPVVVIDNASTDGTRRIVECTSAQLLANSTNIGFAAAVNQGFIVLNCPYIVLLNPDAVLVSDLSALREACELPSAAGAGGLLLDVEGRPQVGFMARQLPTPSALILEALLLNRICPNNPVNRRYRGLGLDYRSRIEVQQPAGAFVMIRRDVWKELGGFDEKFHPLWFEDVDFCRRARDKGYRFFFEPLAVAKHTGGHSIAALSLEMRQFYWYRSLLKYSAKHFRPLQFRCVCLAVAAGSVLRGFARAVQERRFKPAAGYGKVVRLAGRCFWLGREGIQS
jgi:N-acetylglucosaminyl-diphospho-decaprenol L-rhamnosyltransferase